MTEIIKYACDFCGTQYDTKAEALHCEATHNEPTEFDGKEWMFGKKYPDKLTVRMEDGAECRYHFVQEVRGAQ